MVIHLLSQTAKAPSWGGSQGNSPLSNAASYANGTDSRFCTASMAFAEPAHLQTEEYPALFDALRTQDEFLEST